MSEVDSSAQSIQFDTVFGSVYCLLCFTIHTFPLPTFSVVKLIHFVLFVCVSLITFAFPYEICQLLHNLKTLSIADMGVIPYELLVPLGQLKALNLSGNHLVNVSMQILQPVNGLEVSRHRTFFL